MVQYVLTPWRDRHELLVVRRQFYALNPCLGVDDGPSWLGGGPRQISGGGDAAISASTGGALQSNSADDNGDDQDGRRVLADDDDDEQRQETRRQQHRQAVARVSMWMQRGNCPHMVESTALLTAAMLSDEDADLAVDNAASAAYAVRAAYSAAFSRFVTGLLDGHQDKQRKQSMYSLAKTIGLPATFVELRHQSTHEQLPSLAKLRTSARKALLWIWDYYWKHLEDVNDPGRTVSASRPSATTAAAQDPCEVALLRYLREDTGEEEASRRRGLVQLRKQWDTERLLRCLATLQSSLPGNQAYLKCRRLQQELREASTDEQVMEDAEEEPSVPAESEKQQSNLAQDSDRHAAEVNSGQSAGLDTGWSLYEGPWKPKPIGMV